MVFDCPGPPIFNHFCNCFRTPSRTSFLVFFCRFVGRQGSRFGANGLHFLTPTKINEKNHAFLRGCMRVYAKWGGGCLTKIKDMPIRNGFPHQFTPAVPKGTVADFSSIFQNQISQNHVSGNRKSRNLEIRKSENSGALTSAKHLSP